MSTDILLDAMDAADRAADESLVHRAYDELCAAIGHTDARRALLAACITYDREHMSPEEFEHQYAGTA